MSIMCSAFNGQSFITFDHGIAQNGDASYRISWWNGKKWRYARYTTFDAAYATYKLLTRRVS